MASTPTNPRHADMLSSNLEYQTPVQNEYRSFEEYSRVFPARFFYPSRTSAAEILPASNNINRTHSLTGTASHLAHTNIRPLPVTCPRVKTGDCLCNLPQSGDTLGDWANAPEYIPLQSNYEEGAAFTTTRNYDSGAASTFGLREMSSSQRYYKQCSICGKYRMHPTNKHKRKMHRQLCQQLHYRSDGLSLDALERSRDKSCAICYELIMEKPFKERRFGILTNCKHCFCLSCIRTWRQGNIRENSLAKSCPVCRIASDFVVPSIYWSDTEEQKDAAIQKYKEALSEKNCRYFRQGTGQCRFGNRCFYLHALPDGTKIDVGPPPPRRRFRQRVSNLSIEDMDINHLLEVRNEDNDIETMLAFMVLAAFEQIGFI